jgi:hypothetical protein
MYRISLSNKASIGICLALLLSVVLNIFLYSKLRLLPTGKEYQKYYGEYIKSTETEWRRENRPVGDEEIASRYANVIELQNTICVSFEFKRSSVGGVPAYCFDKVTGKLTASYKGGE